MALRRHLEGLSEDTLEFVAHITLISDKNTNLIIFMAKSWIGGWIDKKDSADVDLFQPKTQARCKKLTKGIFFIHLFDNRIKALHLRTIISPYLKSAWGAIKQHILIPNIHLNRPGLYKLWVPQMYSRLQ